MLLRFVAVGVGATLIYLGVSLALLSAGMVPQLANIVAFLASTTASYFGHYFFTYRSSDHHLHVSARFVTMTAGLSVLCSGLHQAVLLAGASPRAAALAVTLAYPPLSFLINNFWVYARGKGKHGSCERGKRE